MDSALQRLFIWRVCSFGGWFLLATRSFRLVPHCARFKLRFINGQVHGGRWNIVAHIKQAIDSKRRQLCHKLHRRQDYPALYSNVSLLSPQPCCPASKHCLAGVKGKCNETNSSFFPFAPFDVIHDAAFTQCHDMFFKGLLKAVH